MFTHSPTWTIRKASFLGSTGGKKKDISGIDLTG